MRNHVAVLVLTSIAVSAAFVADRGDGRAQAAPPPHYNFAGSRIVTLSLSPPSDGYEDTAETGGATLEPGEPTCVPGGGATVWYIYHPGVTGNLLVDTGGSGFSTFVSVYRITDMAPSPPGGSLEEITCAGGSGSQAQVEFTARTGEGGYAIQAGGVGGETGRLQLRLSCIPGVCPPPNDDIGSVARDRVSEMPFLHNGINTSAASVEAGEPLPCGDIGRTIWYRFDTSEIAGDAVSVIASAADFDPVMAVYKLDFRDGFSPPGALSELACVFKPGEDFPVHTFTTEVFTTYYVQIGGAGGAGGELSVLLSCQRPPGQSPCLFTPFAVEGPDSGPGADSDPDSAGALMPPETGSGGYLPGAR